MALPETCRDFLAEPGRLLSPETCRDIPPLDGRDMEFDLELLGAFDGPRDPELGREPALEADEGAVPERPAISGTSRAWLERLGLHLNALTVKVFRAALARV